MGVSTRHSLKMQETEVKRTPNKSNRHPSEREVRESNYKQKSQKVQHEVSQIMNLNKIDYNIFIAHELKINESVSPILHSI